jgi:hypothetical protein
MYWSMDDYLYIIIGIAWVAYSFYSNKQKQDRKRAAGETKGIPTPPAVPPVRSFLEELLMGEVRPAERTAEKNPEKFEPEYIPTTEAFSSETIKTEAESLEVIVDEVPADYFEKEYAGREKVMRVLGEVEYEAEPETEEPGFEIAREFNLKTAVIYAEILNPRHF